MKIRPEIRITANRYETNTNNTRNKYEKQNGKYETQL